MKLVLQAFRDDGGAFAIADDEGTIHLIDASGENIATIGPRTEQSDRITQNDFQARRHTRRIIRMYWFDGLGDAADRDSMLL